MNPFVSVGCWRKILLILGVVCLLKARVLAANSAGKEDSFSYPNLAVGTDADGRLEVFQVDRRGELRHRWQGKSPHEWSSWSTLGSGFCPGVAVVSDAGGRLIVFTVDRETKTVRYKQQQGANSTAWSDWAALPGQKVHPPVAAALAASGQVEVFAVAADSGSLRRIRQADDTKGWLDWKDLGATVEPGPVVARNATDQLEVFGIDARTHDLLHCWQSANGKPDDWSAWSSLGKTMLPGFAVGPNTDRRLEIAGVTAKDGMLVHASQLSARPESAWTPWDDLGNHMKPAVAMGRNDDGRIEIFVINATNNMIFHTFQKNAGASTNWAGLTDMGAATLSYPAVGNNFEGLLEIFAVDQSHDEVLNHRRIIRGNLLWTDWVSLDHSRRQYMARVWRIEDGLPENRVQAIAQTRDGYLWIGTHGGLAKFDGVRFSVPDVEGIGDPVKASITCLLVDPGGELWIGSDGKGLARIDGDKVSRFGIAEGLAGNDVTSICQGRDSTVWIGTQSGLSRFRQGAFTNYTTRNGLLSDAVNSAIEDSAGNLWVSTAKGLTRLGGRSVRSYTQTNGLPDNSVKGIWQDLPERLWIGSSEGMILYRGNRFFAYGPEFGLPDRFVNVIRNDSQGTLWVGTCSGLDQFEDGMFLDERGNQGADFGRINALFEDRERNLWAGSENGLIRLTPKKLLVYDQRQGITRNNITTVMEDGDGSLWIGTSGGGLNQLRDQIIRSYTPATGFSNDVILSICSGDGSVWAGSDSFGGLTQLKDGKITRYNLPEASAGTAINALLEDRNGNLWIGASDGLGCMRRGSFVTNEIEAKIAGAAVRVIAEDEQSGLWFGTDRGLGRWADGKFVNFAAKDGLPKSPVTALYHDQQQVLWIGTQNGGLARFQNGVFTTYSTRDGLFSDEIFEIVEDDFGWLWMSCSKGIFRVRKTEFEAMDSRKSSTLNCIAYGHDDGMESVLCSQSKPGGCKTRDGQLWFPTSEGLVAIDAKSLNINHEPPPVYLEQVVANHKLLPRHNDSPRGFSSPPAIRVPPGGGDLEFHYTALNFQRPERLRFKYRLGGIDAGWIDADTRRVAYYNNLPPGNYSFDVIACNNSGIWNEQGASLEIELLPHFWQTWWFRIVLATLALAVLAGIYRARAARNLEIERLRVRIAADLHDDIGSNLASIALLSDLEQETKGKVGGSELTEINRIALSTANGIREIVWYINPECDTLPELVTRMKEVAAQMLGGLEYRFQGPDKSRAGRLSPEFRRNVFLAYKETLHNIVRHAQARHVDIQISEEHDRLLLKVADDGRGFDVNAASRGNGLRNMRLRIEQLDGRLEIISSPGKGTVVSLSINIT